MAPKPADEHEIITVDGRRLVGAILEEKPGLFLVLQPNDGSRPQAIAWERIERIDGKPKSPSPAPTSGSLIPEGFSPGRVVTLAQGGKRASELLPNLVAPKDGTVLIGSIQGAQDLLESVGLKRGPPNPMLVVPPMIYMPFCFEMAYGTFGRADGTGAFSSLCKYVLTPMSIGFLVLAPFLQSSTKELVGPSRHHLDLAIYALDYSKKSAVTGALRREPQGNLLGNNLGYDVNYNYIHPKNGLLAYGHTTLQQTSIARSDYTQLSSSFFKADAQIGLDFVRLLSKGDPNSWWTQHLAYVRGGPSVFHTWVLSRDIAGNGASVDNPANRSMGLSTGFGFEVAAELDVRFPAIKGWSTGGLHFQFERGFYPALDFPSINARDAAFIALIGFDDLRQGSSYSWQRLKLDLELPLNFSRHGGMFVGGQLASYQNNFGSGVDNRGLSLDYRYRF